MRPREPDEPPPGLARRGDAVAPLETRRVRLRIVRDEDLPFLYELLVSPSAGGRARFAGATPSPEQVARSMWDGVLVQFVVEGAGTREPLGLFVVSTPNFRDGYAYVSVVAMDEVHGTGLVAEGALVGANYAFTTWPFRKLYLEVAMPNYPAFRSGLDRFFVEEGRLRRHVFMAGEYHDMLILAVHRERWAELAPVYLPRLLPQPGDASPPGG